MPLISLIQDQIMQLESLKSKIYNYLKNNNQGNCFLTENNIFLWCKHNTDLVIDSIKKNTLKILFITPEMLT